MHDPFLNLDGYRWFNDDGDLLVGGGADATPKGDEDTSVDFDTGGEKLILATRVHNEGPAPSDFSTWQLQYNLESAGWFAVTPTSDVVRAVEPDSAAGATDSSLLSDPDGLTYDSDPAVTADNNDGGVTTATLDGDSRTHHCWTVQLVDADVSDGETLQFRVLNGNGVFDQYAVLGTCTISTGAAAASLLVPSRFVRRQPHLRM